MGVQSLKYRYYEIDKVSLNKHFVSLIHFLCANFNSNEVYYIMNSHVKSTSQNNLQPFGMILMLPKVAKRNCVWQSGLVLSLIWL